MTDQDFLNELRRGLGVIIAALARKYGPAIVSAFLANLAEKNGLTVVVVAEKPAAPAFDARVLRRT